MKEKIILSILMVVEFIIILLINFYPSNNNSIIFNKEKINTVSNNNLSMMLETDYDSNQYELTTSNEWPTEGYIFNAEMSACKNGSKVAWDETTNRVLVYSGNVDSCYIYFDKEPNAIALADYIKNTVYTGADGENDLYYHDGIGSYTNASEEAADDSYRYAGANPNNYVCFGSDEVICPTDNLYRIIGLFGSNVKLLKYDYVTTMQLGIDGAFYSNYLATGYSTSYYKGQNAIDQIGIYYWNNATSNNIWSESNLNLVNLNANYLNYLNEINTNWVNMIETVNWVVGGSTVANLATVNSKKTAYNMK